jgi:hypothetical protein
MERIFSYPSVQKLKHKAVPNNIFLRARVVMLETSMKARAVVIGLVAVLALLGVCLYFGLQQKRKHKRATFAIPNTIWTFWHDPELPPLVRACIDSWKRYHPDFDVVVLSAANVHHYMDASVLRAPWIDGLARMSDVIRLHVLETHGGVWADASIMLYGQFPLVAKHFRQYEFMGYYLEQYTTNRRYPVLEAYCFATVPNGNFITKWRQAFMSFLAEENVVTRVHRFERAQGVDTQALGQKKYYLLVDVAAQYVMQKQMTPKEITQNMLIADAEADDGPFHYMKATGWDRREGLMRVLRRENKSPIVKFTAVHRGIMDSMGIDVRSLQ